MKRGGRDETTITTTALIVLCAALCGLIARKVLMTKVQRITKEELKALLHDPSVVVIDVQDRLVVERE